MKTKKYSKGFTLVELLVVIAIIGILAAVVLTSIASTRVRAQKAGFKQEVTSAIPWALDQCLATSAIVTVPAGKYMNTWSVPAAGCGPNNALSFSVTVNSNIGIATCTATASPSGAVFAAACD